MKTLFEANSTGSQPPADDPNYNTTQLEMRGGVCCMRVCMQNCSVTILNSTIESYVLVSFVFIASWRKTDVTWFLCMAHGFDFTAKTALGYPALNISSRLSEFNASNTVLHFPLIKHLLENRMDLNGAVPAIYMPFNWIFHQNIVVLLVLLYATHSKIICQVN